jgi:hypothetical protein
VEIVPPFFILNLLLLFKIPFLHLHMKNTLIILGLVISSSAMAQNYESIMSPKIDSVKSINLHIKKAEKIEKVEFIMQFLAVVSLSAITYTYNPNQSMAIFSVPIGLAVGSFIVGGMANREYRKGYKEIGYDY